MACGGPAIAFWGSHSPLQSCSQDHQSIAVTLPETLQPGLAWLEVTKGCMLSSPLPLLVCPEKALAEELREWALQNTACNELLTDVGLLMSEISNPAEAEQLLPTAHRWSISPLVRSAFLTMACK